MFERLGWLDRATPRRQINPTLFPELNEEEKLIKDLLVSVDTLHQDQIGWKLNLPASRLNSALFQLEMKGVIVSLPGKKFRLQL
jgi:DNA processing protein